jgi:hypothetical protein
MVLTSEGGGVCPNTDNTGDIRNFLQVGTPLLSRRLYLHQNLQDSRNARLLPGFRHWKYNIWRHLQERHPCWEMSDAPGLDNFKEPFATLPEEDKR